MMKIADLSSFSLGELFSILGSTLLSGYSLFFSIVVGVGPASVMVGNLVAGKRIAQAAGRDLGLIEDQDLVRKVVYPVYPVKT